ncbi:hypothetical protein D3C80_1927920 [compost metagenome]
MQHQFACLHVLVVLALCLLQTFIDHHFFVLIVEQEQVGFRRQLAAEDADLIHFIVYRRLNYPVMLFGHVGDFLQAEVRQQVLGDLVTGDYRIAGEIVHQQA